MCQNEGTLKLLEVGTETAAKFAKQAKGISPSFLLSALDLTNTYALQYKNSLHPHLQVELCLMQLASINEAEKKKTKPYIKPFREETAVKEALTKENTNNTQTNESASLAERPAEVEPAEVKPAQVEPIEATEIQLDLSAQGVSGLSLSSLRVQKEHQEKRHERKTKQLFNLKLSLKNFGATLEQLRQKMTVNGARNMVALLGLDIPRLKNKTEIHLIVQNDTNKLELEKNSKSLMQYLREHLRNDHINLQVHVDTKEEKKFVYTNKDKYEELSKKKSDY